MWETACNDLLLEKKRLAETKHLHRVYAEPLTSVTSIFPPRAHCCGTVSEPFKAVCTCFTGRKSLLAHNVYLRCDSFKMAPTLLGALIAMFNANLSVKILLDPLFSTCRPQ